MFRKQPNHGQILEILKQVISSCTQPPFSLEDVTGLSVDKGRVMLSIAIDPQQAQLQDSLKCRIEDKIETLPGVESAAVMWTAHRPLKKEIPQSTPSQQTNLMQIRYIIAVASGKGGVGKSTVAVNTALALRNLGLKVGLLDADIYGPSLPKMLGLSCKPDFEDNAIQPVIRYGLKTMSMGYLIPEETPVIWRGPMIQKALQQMLFDVNWGKLDCLVIDLPPGTGDVQLTVVQKAPLRGAIIVSTPQDISLVDAVKGLNMFLKTGVPVLGLIENMSYFNCEACGHKSDVFGHGGAFKEAKARKIPFLGYIPLDGAICKSSDGGKPIVENQPQSKLSTAYVEIAKAVLAQLQQGS